MKHVIQKIKEKLILLLIKFLEINTDEMTRTYDCDDYNDDDDDNCDLCLLMSQTYVRVQAEYTH